MRFRSDSRLLDEIQEQFRIGREELQAHIEKTGCQIRDLQREMAQLRVQVGKASLTEAIGRSREIQGVRVLAHILPATDRAAMREIADELRSRLGSGVVVLGTQQEGKAALIAMVTRDLCQRVSAGRIIKEIAPLVGGSGGGKPELAEAGGKDLSKLADAIDRTYSVVAELLSE